MKPLSIRWKFALWASALTGVVLAVFSAGTFMNLYHEQIEAVDLELQGEAKHLMELRPEGLEKKSADEIIHYQPWLAIAHFDQNGRIQLHSSSLPESLARAALTEKGVHTAHSGTTVWRLGAWSRQGEVFVVAHDLEEVHEIVADLVMGYSLSLPLVLLIAGFGGWWVAGRALRPVRDLTAAVENVQAARLDQRVPVPAANDETQRLATVFNAMLARLGTSFAQAQRFAADASHELRTPLTIMHGEVERLLHDAGVSPAQEEKLLSLQEEIGRLDRITEHLLLLARFDAGKVELNKERIDLSALAREACEDADLLAAVRDQSVSRKIEDAVFVTGDSAHLRRLLLNLLQNATQHNRPGGEIVCTVTTADRKARLSVTNTGPGIPKELHGRLFERFFRADVSRTQRNGQGLGLSLCKEIVQAHGGEIALGARSNAEWTEFVVTLPAAGK